jgi:hypothetical protein
MFHRGALNYLMIPVQADGLYALKDPDLGGYVIDGKVVWAITQDTAQKLAEDILASLDTFPPTLAHYLENHDA